MCVATENIVWGGLLWKKVGVRREAWNVRDGGGCYLPWMPEMNRGQSFSSFFQPGYRAIDNRAIPVRYVKLKIHVTLLALDILVYFFPI